MPKANAAISVHDPGMLWVRRLEPSTTSTQTWAQASDASKTRASGLSRSIESERTRIRRHAPASPIRPWLTTAGIFLPVFTAPANNTQADVLQSIIALTGGFTHVD